MVQAIEHHYPLSLKWEKKMHVQVNEFGIKKMKTKWGTYSRRSKDFLNLSLPRNRRVSGIYRCT
jgi:predicted metal-dependent hydrolase